MNNLSGQFRKTTWDPILIISQIMAVQTVMYFCLGFWIWIIASMLGSTKSLDYAFQYKEIHVRDFGGRSVIIIFLLNALVGALALWWLVQRTKQCMDFACTAHLIHLICCWAYNGTFPTSFSWWCLNIVSLSIMCVCGEFLCMRTELQAIPLVTFSICERITRCWRLRGPTLFSTFYALPIFKIFSRLYLILLLMLFYIIILIRMILVSQITFTETRYTDFNHFIILCMYPIYIVNLHLLFVH